MSRLALLLLPLCSCLYTSYIAQGAAGQLDLIARARPLEDVVRDRETPLRTAVMLAEIPAIKNYGRSYGLTIRHNYETYVQLDRRAAVWFVGAAQPDAFKPRPWCFPIVGCFPGLGFFDEDEAVAFKLEEEADGYDAIVRPAAAYSTGGWFRDSVLSTMLGGGNEALPYLANVILHESVHATVLVPDEQFFNETFATYVADVLTDYWMAQRFGPGSPEDLAWTLGQAISLPQVARRLAAYEALKAVYESHRTREQKLAAKQKIIDELVMDLHLRVRPNNATLTEVKLYNGGLAPLKDAHKVCGDLRSLVEVAKTLRREDFAKTLQDDLVPIATLLGNRCIERRRKTGSVHGAASR